MKLAAAWEGEGFQQDLLTIYLLLQLVCVYIVLDSSKC